MIQCGTLIGHKEMRLKWIPGILIWMFAVMIQCRYSLQEIGTLRLHCQSLLGSDASITITYDIFTNYIQCKWRF